MCCREVFLVLCCGLVIVNCFNLDTIDYGLHRGDRKSMFGFSVASHSFRGQNWIIVGAPEAQSMHQPTVYQGGAVYFCPVDREDGCREISFDKKGNNNNSAFHQIDEKSRQWFGATVSSGGPDQPVVACAPRYLWFTTKNDRRDPVGTCYVASSDLRSYAEFSPCRTRHWGYHRQGTCQAGLGAAISKNGERLFIGAPGSWYWQGQMYSIDSEARFTFTPPRFSDYGAGQLYSQHLKKRPSVFFTKEGEPFDDDSYMGYSVTVGNFTGDADGGIAAGMPRGNRLKGKVVMYTWNLTNHQNISGSQLGAYFGYAIAAADMNGDGLDDLIVGAPLHTEPNNEGKYEVGRVYVIYPVRIKDDPDAGPNAVYPKLRKFDTRDGINSKGRFGLSVASLGDLDLDGYQDIAIGAPYDGPHERGAVYIYYGSKNGIRKKASQVIYGDDLGFGPLYTFGFSVSGNNIDLDKNQYPDLVVGAYLSDAAFIFRSRPVINVEGSVKFHAHKKQISLEERNCSLTRDKYVSCTSMEACVKYNGVGVSNGIELVMEFILDAKKSKDPRMFLYPSERRHRFNETWTLRRNDLQCKRMQVYIKNNTRDKLTPLEIEMRYSLQQRSRRDVQAHPNPRSELLPVLNGNLPSSFKDSIVIKKNCGEDDVCIPDLRLFVTPSVDKYLLGSDERLKIDVKVMNEGEDSFESMYYMKVPPGINYFNTEQVDGSQVKCSAPSEATNNTLKCDIGNPLPAAKMVHFRVLLDPFKVEGMRASYDFSMKINSTNPEDNSTIMDNIKDLSVEIWVKTNISLTGWAQNPDIHYKEDTYKTENYTSEAEIGPSIVHIYSIKNNGPSDINEADVIFMWPSATLEGDDLLYLMEQPEVQGKISCEFVPEANPLKVELLSKKFYLDATTSDTSKLSGQVSYEEKQGHIGITGNHRYDQKKIEKEDKLSETGDSSLVHVDRRKESSKAERTQGQSTFTSSSSGSKSSSSSSNSSSSSSSSSAGAASGVGGQGKMFKEEHTYQWNSSSINGGPVQTWSKNTSSVTDDGVTRYNQREHAHRGRGQNQNQNINNYNIIYTSTGNQQNNLGNQFENGHSQQQGTIDKSYSISQQSNLGLYDFNREGGQFESRYGQNRQHVNKYDQTDKQYGTVHHTAGQVPSEKQPDRHGYFNWDNTASRNTGTSFGTVKTHQTTESRQNGQSGTIPGSSGSIGTDGEMVYSQTGHGTISGSGEMVYSEKESSGQIFGQSGQSGLTHRQSGQTYGQSGQTYEQSGQTYEQSGQTNSQSGQTYGQSGRSYGHSAGHVYGQSSGQDRRQSGQSYGEASYGQSSYGQSSQEQSSRGRGQSSHGTVVSSGSGQDTGTVYREFIRISDRNLTGLISEEDLRRMMEAGNGEFSNGTHRIRWTTKHGGFRILNATDSYRPIPISTEESVNQNIDEYTRRITQGQTRHQSAGRNRSTYGQYDQSNYDASLGLGGAAIGSGFHTSGVDLGVLNPGQAQGNLEKDYNTYYDPDLGSYEDRSAESHGHSGVSYGTSRAYSSGRQASRGQGQHGGSQGSYETHSSRQYSYGSGQSSGNIVGDNVPTDHPLDTDYRHRIYRAKRQIDDDISDIIQCKSTKCSVIRCRSGPLVKDEEAWAALRFRGNAGTLKKIGWNQVVTVSSMMVSRINKLPYIGTPLDRPIHTHEVFNNVTLTETEIKPDVVPLWVVVLSACAGAIILLLLIFLLYKCGFFKRNRPSDAPERQPLNRNGHYNGDEQL